MNMIISWNVRGLNNAGKCNEITTRLKKLDPDIAILVETRVKLNKVNSIRNKFGNSFSYIDNYSKHLNGRIWILWNNNRVNLVVEDCTDQLIHVRVQSNSGDLVMWCTAIYAHNQIIHRRQLWRDIAQIHGGIDGPWMCMGDFNNVVCAMDRIGGRSVQENEYIELTDMMKDADLHEKESQGDHFTWSKKHSLGTIYTRIDRVIGNMDWHQKFVNYILYIMELGVSDHSLLFLKKNLQQRNMRNYPFKFPNAVVTTEGFLQAIEENWNTPMEGNVMYVAWKKIRRLQPIIK
ncbi:uncharacterized protein LOC131650179 [Vicia villosa]|uniref:uncharacterized protein LOC131650179 n=1 Tax=Vicia villosa TaxID=3911 RepID=UPI00273B911F|nr:uncharacterized protein LOC131650179 [Vicia villosa]